MQYESVDSIYGRDALVLYLQDVRDLEVMKGIFKQKIAEGDAWLDGQVRKYLTPAKTALPKTRKSGCLIAVLVFFALTGLVEAMAATLFGSLALSNAEQSPPVYAIILAGLEQLYPVAVIVGVLLAIIWYRKRTDAARLEDARRANAEDDERLRNNRQWIEEQCRLPWQQKRAFLKSLIDRTEDALTQNYDLNIIPAQYRSLASAQYLYDFMSTSHQPFAQALDHAQIEEGIRRIEAKLNVIIRQNEAQLRQLSEINTNTQTLIQQGNAILAAQVATAYYARSAAAHARAIDAKLEGMQSYVRYGF